MTLNLGTAPPWVGAAVLPGNAPWDSLVTVCTAFGRTRRGGPYRSAPPSRLSDGLLERTRHHAGHELPLEREEHEQRDHHGDERARCQDVDVVGEGTHLGLQ